MRLGNIFGFRRLSKRIDEFRRDESGVMIVFTLYLLIGMLIITGLSIDLARVEFVRTKLQNTLDRAILAASDLDSANTTDAEVKAVVLDYFAKSGLGSYINEDDITIGGDGLGSRSVSATASAQVPSWFLRFVGIDSMLAPASGAAEESVSNIEVILVLDVSGSMYKNYGRNPTLSYRLDNLKASATNFVNTVLTSTNSSGKITVGIVMYNGQVQVHPSLLAQYNLSPQANSRCVKFSDSDFNNTAITPGSNLTSYNLFDEWTGQNDVPRDAPAAVPFCSDKPGQRMVLPSNSPSTLIAAIGTAPTSTSTGPYDQGTGMMGQGYTSIDTGVKWGAALLDPSLRTFYNSFLPTEARGRPFDWDQDATMKYLIVMSDGENTSQYDLKSNYQGQASGIWVDSQGRVSVYYERGENNSSSNPGDRYYRIGLPPSSGDMNYDSNNWNSSAYPNSIQMTWRQVFERYSIRWVAYNLLAMPRSYGSGRTRNSLDSTFRNEIYGQTQSSSNMDDRLSDICTRVKTRGDDHMLLFTIAFSAPDAGKRALEDCATNSTGDLTNPSPYFFDAANSDALDQAFGNIARRITELRLTQ